MCGLDEVTVSAIEKFGCTFSRSTINKILKEMKKNGLINIIKNGEDFNKLSAKTYERKNARVILISK